jgi:hypothetical protein
MGYLNGCSQSHTLLRIDPIAGLDPRQVVDKFSHGGDAGGAAHQDDLADLARLGCKFSLTGSGHVSRPAFWEAVGEPAQILRRFHNCRMRYGKIKRKDFMDFKDER